MQNVPKIVRDRLQRPGSVVAEPHPDADLLTAFAERSLATGEREHVLQRLSPRLDNGNLESACASTPCERGQVPCRHVYLHMYLALGAQPSAVS